MRNIIFALLLIIPVGLLVLYAHHSDSLYIEREIDKITPEANKILCGNRVCIVTIVWNKEDIIYTIRRNVNAPIDSIIQDSIKAELFLNKIKRVNK